MNTAHIHLERWLMRTISRMSVVLLVLFLAGTAQAQEQTPEQKAAAAHARRPMPKGKPVVYTKAPTPAAAVAPAPAAVKHERPAAVKDAPMAAPAAEPTTPAPAVAPAVAPVVAPESATKATPLPSPRKQAPPVRTRKVEPVGTEAPKVPTPPVEQPR